MKTKITDKILSAIKDDEQIDEKGPVASQRDSSKAELSFLKKIKLLQRQLRPGIWKGSK